MVVCCCFKKFSVGNFRSCTIQNVFRVKSAPGLLIDILNMNGGNFKRNQIKHELIQWQQRQQRIVSSLSPEDLQKLAWSCFLWCGIVNSAL